MPACSKSVFVVPETDHAHIPRHAVVLALVAVDTQGTGRKAITPCRIGFEVRSNVLQQASFDLLIKRAAAPTLEDIRGIAGLHHGGELGLEGFIFEDGDLDGDIRMRSHIIIGHLLPVGEARVLGCDMPPGNGDGFTSRCFCAASVAGASVAAGSSVAGASVAAGSSVRRRGCFGRRRATCSQRERDNEQNAQDHINLAGHFFSF